MIFLTEKELDKLILVVECCGKSEMHIVVLQMEEVKRNFFLVVEEFVRPDHLHVL